jgi:hypothetical protein
MLFVQSLLVDQSKCIRDAGVIAEVTSRAW